MPAPHIDLICKHSKVLPFEDALACHMPLIECQSVNLSFMLRPPRKAASSPRPLPSLKRRVSSRYAQNGCRKSLRERRRSRFVALSALTQAGYPSQPQGSKRFGWTGTESMNEWVYEPMASNPLHQELPCAYLPFRPLRPQRGPTFLLCSHIASPKTPHHQGSGMATFAGKTSQGAKDWSPQWRGQILEVEGKPKWRRKLGKATRFFYSQLKRHFVRPLRAARTQGKVCFQNASQSLLPPKPGKQRDRFSMALRKQLWQLQICIQISLVWLRVRCILSSASKRALQNAERTPCSRLCLRT